MSEPSLPAIDVVPLFADLDSKLIQLLDGLSLEDWEQPTACGEWTVRDIAAHLLDTSLRRLAQQRDRYFPPPPGDDLSDYGNLVEYLNQMNASWVVAARRLSARVLRDLLEWSGDQLCDLWQTLDPAAPALFPVSWAGESASQNWFDLAREYTERWHHQQQIRDAVGASPLFQRRFLYPVLDTFMRGLPHHYRSCGCPQGTVLAVRIEGEAGGEWRLLRGPSGWGLHLGGADNPDAHVTVSQDLAWRIFTNGTSPTEAESGLLIRGDRDLALHFITARSVMV